ncbi:Alpha/Beta hydrolase protein [Dichotomocladium elegans]|nr:Alpha/Beta hydrolase protein [Dichotomocladium elegans]
MFLSRPWIGAMVVGFWSSILLRGSQNPKSALPSLRVNPSDSYTLDFYPGGHFLELPQGIMRYWLFGNPKGERVVLVHGISSGAVTYDKLARDLVDEGFHVLVYDLWGRGYSDAPPANYDDSLYTIQLALLLQKVGWTKAHVVGVSLGGGIATSFSAVYPELVDKLVLIAPVGLMESSPYVRYAKILRIAHLRPLLHSAWFRQAAIVCINRFYQMARSPESKQSAEFEKLATAVFSQFSGHAGFFHAVTSTVMDFPFDGLADRYRLVAKHDIPVLVIWGDKDKTVPFHDSQRLQEIMPKARLIRYEGSGHDVIITRYQSVDQDIIEFLK